MEKEKEMKGAFVERDLSWMYFNHRILQEASKQDLPPLERLSFLGIYSNNLDEFFRVRMASLSRLLETDDKSMRRQVAGIKQTIATINEHNSKQAQISFQITNIKKQDNTVCGCKASLLIPFNLQLT